VRLCVLTWIHKIRVVGFVVSDGQGEHASDDAGRRERFRADDGTIVQGQLPRHRRLAGQSGRGNIVTATGRVHQWPGPGAVLQEARRENRLQSDVDGRRFRAGAHQVQVARGHAGVDETERVLLHVVHHH